jgi:transposase
MHSWVEEKPLRLIEQAAEKDEPKAIACYGLDIRKQEKEEVWIRFVEGNPNSSKTIGFLKWALEKTDEKGVSVLLMLWDHASWHKSKMVRKWISTHNQSVKKSGQGTRLLAILLPKKSPWLNPIEPRWIHAKRKIMEPDRKLSIEEIQERVYRVFQQPALPLIHISSDEL